MTGEDRERLVAAYLALAKADDEAQKEVHWWAWEAVREMLWHDPESAWTVILELIERAADDYAIAYVAAGPLEDLLADHGPAFIDRVEARAAEDARFLRALTGVWGSNRMEEGVFRRLEALTAGQPPL